MEDAATAEISRSQIWQWVHSSSKTVEGTPVTPASIRKIADEVTRGLRAESGHSVYDASHFQEARDLFELVALSNEFPNFLTVPAYTILEN
jgi:malate synthase